MADKIFASGFYFEKPKQGSPSWIKGKMSIKAPDAIPFLQKHQNNAGYVNLDLKMSQDGKLYLELNTLKPTKDKASEQEKNQQKLSNMGTSENRVEYPDEEVNPDGIPF